MDAARVASSAALGWDEGGTAGETLGLGAGVGANVTWGPVRRAGVLDDDLGPLLLRCAETRLRIAPGRESPDKGVISSASANGSRRFIQIAVYHWSSAGREE